MSEQDKACPFCGCTTINDDSNSLLKWKVCDWCGAEGPAEKPESDPPQGWNIRTADLAQAPAPVRVKALQWREEYQKWSADSYTATATGVGCTYIIASSMDDPNHDAVVDAKKAAAQADYEQRILAALEAPDAAPTSLQKVQTTPDAGVVAELVEALRELSAVSQRAVKLSIQYDDFKLHAMEPMDQAITAAEVVLCKLGWKAMGEDATVPALTNEQAAILGAFTGILCGPFSDLHRYAELKLGRPVWTHEFGSEAVSKQLREASREDFMLITARAAK